MQIRSVNRITFMDFAAKLKELCGRRGLSGRKLADHFGDISSTKANDWLNGRYVPNLHELVRLADLLDVSVEYLARDEVTVTRSDGLTEDERAILDLYRALQVGKLEGLRRLAGKPPTTAVATSPTHAEEQAEREKRIRQKKSS